MIIGRIIYWLAWPFWIVYFKVSNNRCRTLLVAGGKVLIVQGWLSSGDWNLPGGGAKPGEEYTTAAVRELKEEVGIIIDEKDLKSLGDYDHDNYGIKYKLHVFVCNIDEPVELKKQPIEITDARWVMIDELANYRLAKDVIFAVKQYQQNLL